MRKCFYCIRLVLMTVLAFTAGSAWAQEDMTAVEDSAFEKRIRPPAVFHHDAHNEAAGIEDCATCHHVYEDGVLQEYESSEDMECSACHGRENDARQCDLVVVFHKQCKGCHLARQQGPVTCSECHSHR